MGGNENCGVGWERSSLRSWWCSKIPCAPGALPNVDGRLSIRVATRERFNSFEMAHDAISAECRTVEAAEG